MRKPAHRQTAREPETVPQMNGGLTALVCRQEDVQKLSRHATKEPQTQPAVPLPGNTVTPSIVVRDPQPLGRSPDPTPTAPVERRMPSRRRPHAALPDGGDPQPSASEPPQPRPVPAEPAGHAPEASDSERPTSPDPGARSSTVAAEGPGTGTESPAPCPQSGAQPPLEQAPREELAPPVPAPEPQRATPARPGDSAEAPPPAVRPGGSGATSGTPQSSAGAGPAGVTHLQSAAAGPSARAKAVRFAAETDESSGGAAVGDPEVDRVAGGLQGLGLDSGEDTDDDVPFDQSKCLGPFAILWDALSDWFTAEAARFCATGQRSEALPAGRGAVQEELAADGQQRTEADACEPEADPQETEGDLEEAEPGTWSASAAQRRCALHRMLNDVFGVVGRALHLESTDAAHALGLLLDTFAYPKPIPPLSWKGRQLLLYVLLHGLVRHQRSLEGPLREHGPALVCKLGFTEAEVEVLVAVLKGEGSGWYKQVML